jgi:hypothetical protein
MSRASDDLMDTLHGMQAESLLGELRRAVQSGEGVPPALFAQINKYLKDNGVDRAIKPGDPTDLLAEEVPDFGDNIIGGKF